MPCDTIKNPTQQYKDRMSAALARLEAGLANGSAQVVIGAQGAVAFRNWNDNAGLADLCAYRKLKASNSPALRKALARAEVKAGRSIDQRQVKAGMHSHDGGTTWGTH